MTLLAMAASYRQGCALIRLRIHALKAAQAEAGLAEQARLEQRIRSLSAMYRDAHELARILEHYYDRRCPEDER